MSPVNNPFLLRQLCRKIFKALLNILLVCSFPMFVDIIRCTVLAICGSSLTQTFTSALKFKSYVMNKILHLKLSIVYNCYINEN